MDPKNKVMLKELETSLINFLLQKKEVEDKVSGGFRRVRGLVLSLKRIILTDMYLPHKEVCVNVNLIWLTA